MIRRVDKVSCCLGNKMLYSTEFCGHGWQRSIAAPNKYKIIKTSRIVNYSNISSNGTKAGAHRQNLSVPRTLVTYQTLETKFFPDIPHARTHEDATLNIN